jgi:hypothetical protein
MSITGDNRCPVCRAALWFPLSEAVGERDCPRCGARLWALAGSEGPMFFVRQRHESKYHFLAALHASISNTPVEDVEAALNSADSLDVVEFIMEIEDAMKAAGK